MSRGRELLQALANAQVAGFLSQPPGLDGDPHLGLVGIHCVPRGRTWDAAAPADAPEIAGEELTFVVLDDGTIVVDLDAPEGSVAPLADAIEERIAPP